MAHFSGDQKITCTAPFSLVVFFFTLGNPWSGSKCQKTKKRFKEFIFSIVTAYLSYDLPLNKIMIIISMDRERQSTN